jgi:hypothetical protein
MKKEFFQWLSGTDRLKIRFETVKGKVSRLVVQYEAFVGDTWEPIVRYDTAHGFLHKDLYLGRRGGRIRKERIRVADLRQGLIEAIDELEKHWESYKKRFMEGSE